MKRILPLSLLVLLAALLWVPGRTCSVHADGLHCKILIGDDLELTWRRLVRTTWPERADGVAPRVTSHKAHPRIEIAIQELVAVLQFVDAYNYADDSPAWMSTEESRQRTQDQAKAILIELGRGAAPQVIDALEQEIRYRQIDASPQGRVKAFRAAQRRLKDALDALEGQRRQDTEYATALNEYEELRPKVNTLKYLQDRAGELRKERIRFKRDPEKLKNVEADLEGVQARMTKLGNPTLLGARMAELNTTLKARRVVIDGTAEIIEMQQTVDAARKQLQSAQKSSAGLGQNGDVTGGDPAMITTEEFVSHLQEVLQRMGPEALPEVAALAKSPSPELRAIAAELQKLWVEPARVKEFALCAGSGFTKVNLAARKLLKDTLKLDAVEPILKSLPEATPDEKTALFKALGYATAMELPAEEKAWVDWWAQNKKHATDEGDAIPDEDE